MPAKAGSGTGIKTGGGKGNGAGIEIGNGNGIGLEIGSGGGSGGMSPGVAIKIPGVEMGTGVDEKEAGVAAGMDGAAVVGGLAGAGTEGRWVVGAGAVSVGDGGAGAGGIRTGVPAGAEAKGGAELGGAARAGAGAGRRVCVGAGAGIEEVWCKMCNLPEGEAQAGSGAGAGAGAGKGQVVLGGMAEDHSRSMWAAITSPCVCAVMVSPTPGSWWVWITQPLLRSVSLTIRCAGRVMGACRPGCVVGARRGRIAADLSITS